MNLGFPVLWLVFALDFFLLGCSGSGDGDGTSAGDAAPCRANEASCTSVDAGPVLSPPAACEPPITLTDTSEPDHVVGDGSAASCTRDALAAAVVNGGIITFNCGSDVTIDITSPVPLSIDTDTVIDGEGTVTLDGGSGSGRQTRIFEYFSPNYRTTTTLVVLQRLTLQNAQAPASDFTPQDLSNPECAWGYKDGEGGAIRIRDGRLHIIDSVFRNNKAASQGPDTGGGAIFAGGALEVVIVGSTFTNNEGSNGGAIELLQSDGTFYNTVFENNRATGSGQNFGGATGCPKFNHQEQGGAGGNSGAIGVDGSDVTKLEFCGVIFRANDANELGTVTRTPNSKRGHSTFNRCLWDGNHAGAGGAALWMQDMDLEVYASAVIGNTSDGLGAGIRVNQGPHGSTLLIENTTFQGNIATKALGGGLVYSGKGLVRNCTFAQNAARGGVGFFGAAIVAHGTQSQGLRIENTVFLNNIDDHEYTPMTCSVGSPAAPVALPGSGNVQWPMIRNGPSNQVDNECTAGILFSDTMLAALADNGGPTPSMMPPAGSSALGLGMNCPATDQRGEPRPATACAAGAIEP